VTSAARALVPEQGPPRPWDEAERARGPRRRAIDEALAAVRRRGPAAAAALVADAVARSGARFGGSDAPPFVVDPVPRVLDGEEWAALEAGLVQRVRALDAFVADAHGPREAAAAGVVPPGVAEGSGFLERDLRDLAPTAAPRIGVAGLDVVRDEHGAFRVLEDNCRTPSGIAYAVACRLAVAELLGGAPARDLAGAVGPALRGALEATRPHGEGCAVLLTDGPRNGAYWEHRRLTEAMDVPLVTPAELRRRGTTLVLSTSGEAVGAIYRRTDEERLRRRDGTLTALGELLLPAVRAGSVGLLNAFGTGVADDKALYPHVPDLVRFFLGEEPLLEGIAVHDLTDPPTRERTLDRAEELVLKPRDGHGGHGVVIGPLAEADELAAAVAAARADPAGWVAQDVVTLSTLPTVHGDRLEPRHVDLRPFAVADGAGGWRLLPGGLTRVAREAGQMVVNSSRGGGGKDTWVLA
jgi:carboxylate-amine ligase